MHALSCGAASHTLHACTPTPPPMRTSSASPAARQPSARGRYPSRRSVPRLKRYFRRARRCSACCVTRRATAAETVSLSHAGSACSTAGVRARCNPPPSPPFPGYTRIKCNTSRSGQQLHNPAGKMTGASSLRCHALPKAEERRKPPMSAAALHVSPPCPPCCPAAPPQPGGWRPWAPRRHHTPQAPPVSPVLIDPETMNDSGER